MKPQPGETARNRAGRGNPRGIECQASSMERGASSVERCPGCRVSSRVLSVTVVERRGIERHPQVSSIGCRASPGVERPPASSIKRPPGGERGGRSMSLMDTGFQAVSLIVVDLPFIPRASVVVSVMFGWVALAVSRTLSLSNQSHLPLPQVQSFFQNCMHLVICTLA